MGIKKLTIQNLKRIDVDYGPFDTVVDIGCGEKPYQQYISADSYIGIDVEVSGRSEETKMPDSYYDGENLPFLDSSIDLIICTEVLEHCLEPEKIVSEMHRCLKPNGIAFITVPSMWGEHEMPFDFRRYMSNGIRKLLEDNLFHIVDIQAEDRGLPAFVKLGLSEVLHGQKAKYSLRYNIAKYWLLLTYVFFKGISIKMPRIYLSNQVIAIKSLLR
jgi:SAM-dependent methyltransferase